MPAESSEKTENLRPQSKSGVVAWAVSAFHHGAVRAIANGHESGGVECSRGWAVDVRVLGNRSHSRPCYRALAVGCAQSPVRMIASGLCALAVFLLTACAGSSVPATEGRARTSGDVALNTVVKKLPRADSSSLAPQVTRVEAPVDVLFIGNSFTYYNNSLHNHFRQLVRAGKPAGIGRQRVRALTLSGARLVEHGAAFRSIVDSHDWDMVVMQGHSLGPISDNTAQSFQDTAKEFDAYLDQQGIQSALFMTWAYTGAPEMTEKLAHSYTDTGNEIEALVVPVGLAFARVTEQLPHIELRTDDKRHPSLAGSYLAACVFYASLYGESPVGLEYDAGLDAVVAAQLQNIAAATVTSFFARALR